jgi:hypothetical protein
MQGEDTQSGDAYGFKWRQATGWFSYDVKVLPDQSQLLAVSLRGGKKDSDNFDVLVDGKIMTAQPGNEPDAIYLLPTELTQGRQSVTVKFVAHPDKSIAGLTGLRVLRAK